LAGRVEDLLLGCGVVEGAVEVELMYFVFEVQSDSSIDNFDALPGEFVSERPESDGDLNVRFLVVFALQI
jgi:hypothetical protein